MKSFRKFVESYQPVNEAEYNKEWWDSKSDSFKKRYIERHPNSIYAQKATSSVKANTSSPKNPPKAKPKSTTNKNSSKEINQAFFKKTDSYVNQAENSKNPEVLDKYVEKALELKNPEEVMWVWQSVASNEHTKPETITRLAKYLLNLPSNNPFTNCNYVDSIPRYANQEGSRYIPANHFAVLLDHLSDARDENGKKILSPMLRYKLTMKSNLLQNKYTKEIEKKRKEEETQKEKAKSQLPSIDSVKEKYGKRYQNIEDFVSDYDGEQFSKAAADYAYDVADGPDDVENHFDDFDGEYSVNYKDLADKMKKKFGFTPDRDDIAAILGKVGGKVNLV